MIIVDIFSPTHTRKLYFETPFLGHTFCTRLAELLGLVETGGHSGGNEGTVTIWEAGAVTLMMTEPPLICNMMDAQDVAEEVAGVFR